MEQLKAGTRRDDGGRARTEKKALAEDGALERYAGDLAEVARLALTNTAHSLEPPVVVTPSGGYLSESEGQAGGFFETGEAADEDKFSVDHSLTCIEFADEEEVGPLHQSLNSVHLTLEGFPSQNCAAYLCAVQRHTGSEVYFALHLKQTGSVLVYVPNKQPASSEECAQVLHEGIAFAETVGFIMDQVGLDSSDRGNILANPSVFHKG